MDFEHERREEVLQHVYQRYGRERAAMVATVITLPAAERGPRRRQGARPLARPGRPARVRAVVGPRAGSRSALARGGLRSGDPHVARTCSRSPREIQGFPRHLSNHVGRLRDLGGPLDEIVPIENAAMEDRTVIQWDKDDLDALGLLKVDCLALGMLTAIRRAFDLVLEHARQEPAARRGSRRRPRVYRMLGNADTIGVFQIESRAQMAMLPRLRPASSTTS